MLKNFKNLPEAKREAKLAPCGRERPVRPERPGKLEARLANPAKLGPADGLVLRPLTTN